MNRPLKRVAVAILVMFVALLINANYVQVVDASKLRTDPHNSRVLTREYSQERGPIIVSGSAVAQSKPTKDTLKYLRTYPGGPTFAAVTGYYSLVYGASAIEHAENGILSGSDDRLFVRHLSDLITGKSQQGGAVVLTINAKAQQRAMKDLQGKRGAVVALDPTTGAILALASSPSYDPAQLSSHDTRSIRSNYERLLHDPGKPLVDRALVQTYPPGSLFKVITASAALSSGKFKLDSQVPAPTQLKLPTTTTFLKNFGGEVCGNGQTDSLAHAFQISCNTAFANIGLSVGADALRKQAQAFGFGQSVKVPMIPAASSFPANPDRPQTALSAIGQFDVQITPLQGAMIAAAIANGGAVMRPYLVKELQAPDLSTIEQAHPSQLSQAVTPEVADKVKQLMELVVEKGTGTAAQIPGIKVAGKTGTAQHGTGGAPHAWFAGFAPADNPQIAVAVIVEDGGSAGSEATGGTVAAPIAKDVIQAVLGK